MQSSNKGFKPKSKRKHVEGKISGPGTGTSDDIKAQVPAGSYIMPADSTKAIGEQNLAGMGAPVDVNVSNGEFAMPPEKVHAVGVQALNQMKDATHEPVHQPQQKGLGYDPELFFADGGAVQRFSDSVGGYWSSDNAQFEAGNPTIMQRFGRAINPVTGLGSAIGAMHDAAGKGDAVGMGLAAVQAIPVFGAVRAAAPTLKTAAGFVPSAGKTAAATAGSAAFGAAADQYTPREQSFADGGVVEEEKPKKQNVFSQFAPQTPTPTPMATQQKPAGVIDQAAAANQRRMHDPILKNAARAPEPEQATLASVANAGPGTANVGPFKVSHLPNYGSRNRAGPADPEGTPSPDAMQTNGSGQTGRDGFLSRVGDLYKGSAKTVAGVYGAPFGYAIDAVRSGAASLFGGDPDTLPGGRDKYYSAAGESLVSGIDDLKRVGEPIQEVGRNLLGVQPADQPLAAEQTTAQKGQQSDAQQAADKEPAAGTNEPAAGVETYASGIQKPTMVDGVPTFTNEHVRGFDPATANTISSQAMMAPSASTQQALSGAMQAAAARGDFAAVNQALARQGQQPVGGFTAQGGGTRVNVIRDTSRDERERRQLWNAASTAHRGAQNGQLTAAQINAMRGIRNDERTAENNRYATDAGLTREGMSQAGADRRAAATNAIDMRRLTGEEESRGFQNRAAARMESLYDQLDKAAPEDRPAIEEQLRILSGGSKASENLSNNFIKVKRPVYDERGNIIGEQDVPIDLRQFGQQQQAALPPLESNPAVQQILNNTRLSKEERARQIRALGYQ